MQSRSRSPPLSLPRLSAKGGSAPGGRGAGTDALQGSGSSSGSFNAASHETGRAFSRMRRRPPIRAESRRERANESVSDRSRGYADARGLQRKLAFLGL